MLVYCMGPAELPNGYHSRCHHSGRLRLADLPQWDWYEISAHLKCTRCGSVGWVDMRLDWSEVIDFNKGIGWFVAPCPACAGGHRLGRGTPWIRRIMTSDAMT